MRHWREPGIDAMALATNICVTLLLWALLIAAIVLNRKEAHESKSARAKTLNVEYECATKIEQAKREVLKARSDLDDERKRLEREVSRKPGYIKGGAIKVLAKQAEGLRYGLIDLCDNVKYQLPSIPEEVCFPLSNSIMNTPEDQWKWFHRCVWRFQRDFTAHKSAVNFEVTDLSSPVIGMSVPSSVAVDTLIGALDTHHTLLLQRINRLLD
jgi:hypothetical protein